MTRGAPATLEVRGVHKQYGGKSVLSSLSFDVARGEFLALLGPSGAGKTTLVRCIAGLTVPERGEIRLDGVNVLELKGRERRRIAVVFQQFNLVPRLSALQNVLAGRLGHVPSWRGVLRRFTRKDQLLALECLDRVGLIDRARQRADTLSGGQQQRVAIARALAQQPDVIVADEPIASLDPQSSAGILELLRDISRNDGVALVCSLHQLEFARAYADRIAGMTAGAVVVDVPAGQFDDSVATRIYGLGLASAQA
ncbi:MAG: phosphonate ABC transporter ATP-binding protein [Betaproteobacteria bacterium]|nr:phosphonate ABC transporter ATP-binding protein [Betaproteobacteria bacterium]